MRQVFISYSSREAKQANEIVTALETQGINCWIAPRDIHVGSNYTKDIPSAIQECPCFLLVLSRESQKSKWVSKELTRAINQEKRIMPLMIENFSVNESFEFLLEDVQTRPYYQTKKQTLQEVMAEIRTLMQCRCESTAISNASCAAIDKLPPVPAAYEEEQMTVDMRYENHPELNTPYFEMNATERIRIPFAVDMQNKVQYFEIGGNYATHAMIIGGVGTGKSTVLHTMILQIIKNYHPDDVEIWAMDYKGTEFNRYNIFRPPHYRAITTDIGRRLSLKDLIDFLYREYLLRTESFRRLGVQSLIQYRTICHKHCMPRILVIVDDSDLLFREMYDNFGEKYMDKLDVLLRVSRTVGFSFILSTQNPDKTQLSMSARSQIGAYLYFNHPDTQADLIPPSLMREGADSSLSDIRSLTVGQCIYKKGFWNIYQPESREITDYYRVNTLHIDRSTANEIIEHSKELVGTDYAPKPDIKL